MARDERGGLVFGVLLIVVGLILLGHELDLLIGWSMKRLWPLILIALGAVTLVMPREEGGRGGSAWLLFVGVLFLLNNYDVMSIRDSWPLFIVAGGLSILFKSRRRQRPHEVRPPETEVRHER